MIHFELLAEEDAGVVVNKAYGTTTRIKTKDNLDCINLVRWITKMLTFEDGTLLLVKESTKKSMSKDIIMDGMGNVSHEFFLG